MLHVSTCKGSWAEQVINRAKLQRAGKDNIFVRLLYGKDKPRIPKDIEEQEKFGEQPYSQISQKGCIFAADNKELLFKHSSACDKAFLRLNSMQVDCE